MTSQQPDTQGGEMHTPLAAPAHTLSPEAIIAAFGTDIDHGLTDDQAREAEARYGLNKLKEVPPPSFLSILIRNSLNAMTIVLIAAMAVSFGTQDFISGGVIAALVVVNVGVGTVNEYKAEMTVAALEAIGSPTAAVMRRSSPDSPGELRTVKSELVMPGDIVMVKIGDIVPADCRILPGYLAGLECDEALLTGESLPSVKTEEPIEDPVCPVGDRTCMIYSGSQAVKGRAKVICVATGMTTELGKISAAMSKKESSGKTGFAATWHKIKGFLGVVDTTPLQIKLNKLAYLILFFACICAVIVVASTGFRDVPLTIATYAVAAAVSLLPASLPAVIALSLATASRKLAQSNALVRRMDATETLGAVTDVCSDKTGTITLGKMVTRRIWTPSRIKGSGAAAAASPDCHNGQIYTLETGSDPFYPKGSVTMEVETDEVDCELDDIVNPLHEVTLVAALCSSATVQRARDEDGKEIGWEGHGDATEVALQVYAHKLGYGKPHLIGQASDDKDMSYSSQPGKYQLIVEHAFDSSVKRMSMAYICTPGANESGGSSESYILVVMKGAFERVYDRCTSILASCGRAVEDKDSAAIGRHYDALASQGLRVLTLCSKRLPLADADKVKAMKREELETDMSFVGLVGIYDPPRVESALAVEDCHRASIIPRMLTGDHAGTAVAIAQSVGIIGKDYPKSAVMTGPQFDKLTDDEVDQLDPLPSVVARCAPETKVRMVEALYRRGRRCIMTGDGVNDAPSLKRADVGVAMGKNGSDVAKQCAEIVLSDDNFATIIVAVKKGRGIFFNLSKFFLYLMSGNIAQIVLMLIGLAFMDANGQSTFPISPVGILWINTLCAGPPALALGLEETPADAMLRKPHEFHNIFTVWWIVDLFAYGFFMGAIALANFAAVMWGYFDGDLGVRCNEDLDDTLCNQTGRARGAVFASFLFVLLIHAFVCKHPQQSIFHMDLLENKALLWSVVLLGASVFPVVFIPVINDKVFLLFPIKWEWGMVVASMIVFLAVTECYKLLRRTISPVQSPEDVGAMEKDDALALENEIKAAEKNSPNAV